MNESWQAVTRSMDVNLPTVPHPFWMPSLPAQATPDNLGNFSNLIPWLLNLGAALLILVVGFIVAKIVAGLVEGLLKRTQFDNKLAEWISGNPDASPPVEKWVSNTVFWVIMIFVVVAFLERLDLTVVSQPLNNFLSAILGFLPRIGSAALLLGVAWVLATIVKMLVTRALQALNIDRRLGQQVSSEGTREDQFAVSSTLANALYWFIFLLFLPSVLSTLQLEGTLVPVQGLLDEVLSVLPNLLAAGLIIAAGWLVSTVVRRIVTNLLIASGVDRMGERFGLSQTTGSQTLSWLVGTVVYVLVLIPFAIAALDAIQIEAITTPAVGMLNQILEVVPLVFTAGLILIVAYVVGKFVSDLIVNILTGFGFNNLFYWLGLQSRPTGASESTSEPSPDTGTTDGEPTLKQKIPTQTPSEIVGTIALIALMLFATITATDVLGLEALTLILGTILQIAAQVLVGAIVFAIGLYFANLAFKLITSSGTHQAVFLGQAARIAIIILVGAMALQRMGIAPDIVNLAFGLLLGAIAVAIALAFGLGARDIAAEQINEWLAAFKGDRTPRS